MARKKIQNPVLEEHFPVFQHYIDKWQPLLNLNDYRIDLVSKRSNHMSEIEVASADRVATMYVGKHFGGDEVNHQTIESTVLHELLHLRNHDILIRAYHDREYTDAVEAAEHSTIYVFERLLMKLLGDKPQPKPEVSLEARSDPGRTEQAGG